MLTHSLVERLRALPMRGRDTEEDHRVATSLELFYDLVSVVAIAAAAAGLHHAIIEGHTVDGIQSFFFAFWSIWWAWMNFTWFASAYDTDDAPYRGAVFLNMIGAIVLAAGIGSMFEAGDFRLALFGYIIMRLALVSLWLRAARDHEEGRPVARRYAIGIAVLQAGWFIAIMLAPEQWTVLIFLLLIIGELSVPAVANAAGETPWHRHHIIERYGLLTIIVLGELILGATNSATALYEHYSVELLMVTIGIVLLMFAMWSLYFVANDHPRMSSKGERFLWGYGHFLVFSSAAAVGAGMGVALDHFTQHGEITATAARFSVSVPAALYVLSVWLVHEMKSNRRGVDYVLLPLVALAILGLAYLSWGILWVGLLSVVIATYRMRAPQLE